jgi:nitrate reductase beta subunit
MPKVYNWQIGRKMEYRYEEAHPDWQFVAVFNINRCIACQSCTMACKSTWTFSPGQEYMWWNNVETKPYGGYPHHWDVKLLELMEQQNPGGQVWDATQKSDERPYGVFEGKTIFELAPVARYALGYEPTDEEWRSPNVHEDVPTGPRAEPGKFFRGGEVKENKTWFFYLARICNHCTYPACLAACPRQAPYKRKEDGIVLIDQSRCWGYKQCVKACPYKKAMYRATTRTSEKCVACYPRVEGLDPISNGAPMEPRCVACCIGKIRLAGLVKVDKDGKWHDDPKHPLYFLVKKERVALPLYPQFGTEPNVYYIPPRWVPRPYLRQMFGPGVDEAIERYTHPSRELLAVLQLFRASRVMIFRYEIEEGEKVAEINLNGKPLEIYNDTVIGFDRKGREIVRVSVQEPVHVRPEKYLNSI